MAQDHLLVMTEDDGPASVSSRLDCLWPSACVSGLSPTVPKLSFSVGGFSRAGSRLHLVLDGKLPSNAVEPAPPLPDQATFGSRRS